MVVHLAVAKAVEMVEDLVVEPKAVAQVVEVAMAEASTEAAVTAKATLVVVAMEVVAWVVGVKGEVV
jgi:hypothetical protein